MARPGKTLEQHLRDGTFRADRHGHLLPQNDVDAWIAGFGGMESMLLYTLDCGPLPGDPISPSLLPALYERFRGQLMPGLWLERQVLEGDK